MIKYDCGVLVIMTERFAWALKFPNAEGTIVQLYLSKPDLGERLVREGYTLARVRVVEVE